MKITKFIGRNCHTNLRVYTWIQMRYNFYFIANTQNKINRNANLNTKREYQLTDLKNTKHKKNRKQQKLLSFQPRCKCEVHQGFLEMKSNKMAPTME